MQKLSIFLTLVNVIYAKNTYQLYCMDYFRGVRNPIELPNDRCCPPRPEEFVKGIPYSSTIKGCCNSRLYDIYAQVCCKNGQILQKDQVLEAPRNIDINLLKVLNNENDKNQQDTRVQLQVTWGEVFNADSYEIDTSRAFNSTWTQPPEEHNVLGRGDTMGLSTSILENLLVGYSYSIKVRAIDCLNRFGEFKDPPLLGQL